MNEEDQPGQSQDQDQKKQGPVSWTIDKGNTAAQWGKRGKNMFQAGRAAYGAGAAGEGTMAAAGAGEGAAVLAGGGSAAGGVAAAGGTTAGGVGVATGTSFAWGPIIALVVGALIIFAFIITLFGAVAGTKGGNLSNNPSSLPYGSFAPFSGNVGDYFTFFGGTDTQRKALEDYLRIALGYPKYASMLLADTKGKIKITIESADTGLRGGWAVTDVNGNISLYGKYMNTDSLTQKLYLIHETGHSIAYRNGNAAAFYTVSTRDSTCYDKAGYIKTYPTAFHSPGQEAQESFADSLINTIFCKAGESCGPSGGVSGDDGAIQDWPTTCVNTYNWLMQNILVGNSSPNAPAPLGQASNSPLSWANQISGNVDQFNTRCPVDNNYYLNVMLQTVTNGTYTAHKKTGSDCGVDGSSYYCSDLIIDSYNLAGISNNFSEDTRQMINQWQSVSGLTLQKNNNVNGLRVGDAVFWLTAGNSSASRHVDMIQAMDVGQNGTGTITTIDTNTNAKTHTFFVKNWALKGTWSDGANVPWFGLGPR